jgi:rhodanese-related sulfurtransferase
MKRTTQYSLLLILLLAFIGCREKESRINSALDPEAFEKAINQTSEKIILDVRTPEEFNEGHIRNAKLINFHDDNFKSQVNELDKDVPVYVYCASGVRSDKAATMMRAEGFKEVYVLEKGLKDWRDSNKEIVKE